MSYPKFECAYEMDFDLAWDEWTEAKFESLMADVVGVEDGPIVKWSYEQNGPAGGNPRVEVCSPNYRDLVRVYERVHGLDGPTEDWPAEHKDDLKRIVYTGPVPNGWALLSLDRDYDAHVLRTLDNCGVTMKFMDRVDALADSWNELTFEQALERTWRPGIMRIEVSRSKTLVSFN